MLEDPRRKNAPYEMYEETTWEIYDPVNAVTVATFDNEVSARKYLEWLNPAPAPNVDDIQFDTQFDWGKFRKLFRWWR